MGNGREAYYADGTVEVAASRIFSGLGPRQRSEPALAPRHAALLVLDLQRAFLDASSHAYVPSAPAIVPRVLRLVDAFVERGLPVVYTRHANRPGGAGAMGRWWRRLILEGTDAAEIAPELRRRGMSVIAKAQYDAFHGTTLEAQLQSRGVSQVVITGVMTHLCCDTTARSAFVRGFDVFLPVDGSATYTEALHCASLYALAHGVGRPLFIDDVMRALEEA